MKPNGLTVSDLRAAAEAAAEAARLLNLAADDRRDAELNQQIGAAQLAREAAWSARARAAVAACHLDKANEIANRLA